jgi:hypothetical protein
LTTLKSDDRTLAELNETTAFANVESERSFDFEAQQNQVEKLTRALQLLRAETVKDRLDRIYLESQSGADSRGDDPDAQPPTESTLKAAKDDLSSLYAEIDDVATMVVSQEYGSALHVAVREIRRAQLQEKQIVNEQVRIISTRCLIS